MPWICLVAAVPKVTVPCPRRADPLRFLGALAAPRGMASDSESTAMRFHDDLRKAVEPIILHFIAMGLPVLLVWAVPILVDRVLGSEATLIGVFPLLDLVHAGGPAGRADGPSPRRGASTRDRAPRPSRGPGAGPRIAGATPAVSAGSSASRPAVISNECGTRTPCRPEPERAVTGGIFHIFLHNLI